MSVRGNHNERFYKQKKYWGVMPPEYKWAFACVRNPYDRFVSGVAYTSTTPQEAIRVLSDDREPFEPRYLVKHHLLPMTHPYNCIEYADIIMRFENLQEDWKKVCKKAGWEHTPLPHINKSVHRNYRDAIGPALKYDIDQIYKEDFERFGYEW